MNAAVYHEYGTDVLQLEEVPVPVPGDDEVLLKVKAVAINDWDWQMLQGIPFVNRMINGLKKPKKTILGLDVAGRIEAVGRKVTHFQPGDAVYGDISEFWGGFAEYVCVKATGLVAKPDCITFVEAAATPHAATLAVQGLIDVGRIGKGQKVLINGAGGGVGTFGVQIAKLFDTEVTGVDNAGKLDLMRSAGFDRVIDYRRQDFTATGKKYDLILDTKTNRPLSAYLRSLTPDGVYVTVGGNTGRILGQVLVGGSLYSLFNRKKLRLVVLQPNKSLQYVNDLFKSGKIKPVIDGPYPFPELPAQLQRFGRGEHQGKIVIEVGKRNQLLQLESVRI